MLATSQYGRKYGRGHLGPACRISWHVATKSGLATKCLGIVSTIWGAQNPASKFRSGLSVRICTRIPWPLLVIGPVIGTEGRGLRPAACNRGGDVLHRAGPPLAADAAERLPTHTLISPCAEAQRFHPINGIWQWDVFSALPFEGQVMAA